MIIGSVIVMPYQQAFAATPGVPVVTLTVNSGTQVTLTWPTPADNGTPLAGIVVFRSINGAGFTEIGGTVLAPLPFSNSFTDSTGLTLGDSVRYVVRVTNVLYPAAGEFANSAITGPVVTANQIPSTITDLSLSVISGTQVDLSWTPPFNGGSPIVSYTINRNLNGAGFAFLSAPGPSSSFSDTTLSPGDSVEYQMTVTNAIGTSGVSNLPAAVVTPLPGVAIIPSSGGTGCNDCTPPTLGYDSTGKKTVDGGFTYNGLATDAELFFTPYPLITVDIGSENIAELKIYENSGIQAIKHISLGFGLATGEYMSQSNAVINYDIDFEGNGVISQIDPENAIDDDTLRVETENVKCTDSSITEDCLLVRIFHTFRSPLEFDIVGTDVWDVKLNAWQNLFNHGIHIVGDSMNPPKEYDGIHNGVIHHLTQTSKTTAMDEYGNGWTFDYGVWNKDYIPSVKIDNDVVNIDKVWAINHVLNGKFTSNSLNAVGYDRNHDQFVKVINNQILISQSIMNEICPSCDDKPYDKIDNIVYYEFPNDSDLEIYKSNLDVKLNDEEIKALRLLSEIRK